MTHTEAEVNGSSNKPSRHGRSDNGKFAPGNGGGPGRPRGSRAQIAQALDDTDIEDLTAIRDALVRRAKGGAFQPAKLILEQYWPAPKSRLVNFDLPAIDTAADVPKAIKAVIAAMAGGILTTDEGTAFCSIIEQLRRALELVEVEGRLSGAEEVRLLEGRSRLTKERSPPSREW